MFNYLIRPLKRHIVTTDRRGSVEDNFHYIDELLLFGKQESRLNAHACPIVVKTINRITSIK